MEDIESSPISAAENERVKRPLLNSSDDSPQSKLSNQSNDSDLNDISVVVRDDNGMIINKPTDKLVFYINLTLGC